MVIFLGGPGSGKGIQSKLLAKRNNFKIFAVGQMLRNEIVQRTPIGLKMEERINKGCFADLEIVLDLLKSKVDGPNFILDGFPRNLEQADAFEEFVVNAPFDMRNRVVAIDFVAPDELLINRLQKRKICKNCDASILDESKCFACGKTNPELYSRYDDRGDTIIERIKQFHSQSRPLVEFYQNRGIYCPIDGTRSVEEVYNDVATCVNSKILL